MLKVVQIFMWAFAGTIFLFFNIYTNLTPQKRWYFNKIHNSVCLYSRFYARYVYRFEKFYDKYRRLHYDYFICGFMFSR